MRRDNGIARYLRNLEPKKPRRSPPERNHLLLLSRLILTVLMKTFVSIAWFTANQTHLLVRADLSWLTRNIKPSVLFLDGSLQIHQISHGCRPSLHGCGNLDMLGGTKRETWLLSIFYDERCGRINSRGEGIVPISLWSGLLIQVYCFQCTA